MITIDELNKSGVPWRTGVFDGKGGLPMIGINTDWSSAEIYLHGAHVTNFRKKNEAPLLFMSKESRFTKDQPIRGGIPVIFPWFGPREGEPAHGFGRLRNWESKGTETLVSDGSTKLILMLEDCPEMAKWNPFNTRYVVTVGKTLKLELTISNISKDQELTIENCLHTYFTVGDVGSVSISGLKGTEYLDKVGGTTQKTETNDVIRISSEVDRVYMDTTNTVEIRDEKLQRVIRVKKEGSKSTVVWNPWIAKSKAMPDFGDEEYPGMVCVESGNVGKNKLTIAPGQSHTMAVELSSEALT